MKRRKGSKGRKTTSGLRPALQAYKIARTELLKFEETNEALLAELADLQSAAKDARGGLESQVLSESEHKKKGSYLMLTAYGFTVKHKIGARRDIDASKLLKDNPKLANWDGLFSVKAPGFDAVVESGIVKDASKYVTDKFTNSVEIQDGEAN